MYSIHMDKTFWIDPEVFRPERHIDSNGCIIQTDRLLPFGAGVKMSHGLVSRLSNCFVIFTGKRSCLGESLARASYFLFTASLVKAFTFRSIPGATSIPSLAPLNGFTLAHRPFRALLTQR